MYEITLRRNHEEQERSRLRATQMRELIRPAETVVPPNATVQAMTRVFLEYPVKYLYVANESGAFLGVVALKDITSDLLDEQRHVARRPRRITCSRISTCSRRTCRSALRCSTSSRFRASACR